MSMGDFYRTRVAEFEARARNAPDDMTRRQYETLASQYSRLAENADDRDRQTSLRTATSQNQARPKLN
jgi:hypothetical protein